MTTLPTESVLNWSSEKPTYQQIQGKKIIAEWYIGERLHTDVFEIPDLWSFNLVFDDTYPILRYAIIAEPLEAKPLWGHMPNFRGDIVNGLHWIAWGSKTNETWFIETPAFKSEAEAITAWNQLVTKIEGER